MNNIMKKESENQVFHEFLGSLEDVNQKGLNEKISFLTFILTSYRSIISYFCIFGNLLYFRLSHTD